MSRVLTLFIFTILAACSHGATAGQPRAVDYAELCRRVADLETAGKLDSIILPFGKMDIDNDGKIENVSESVNDAGAPVHSIRVIDDNGKDLGEQDCDGCGSSSRFKVEVVSVDGRQYVLSFDGEDHILNVLWEMPADGTNPPQRCAFDQQRTPFIEVSANRELCDAAIAGEVKSLPLQEMKGDYAERPKVPGEFGEFVASHETELDLDNDGSPDTVFQFDDPGLGWRCGHRYVTFSTGNYAPEHSPRNTALSAAETAPCYVRFGIVTHHGRNYVEGRGQENPPFRGVPNAPYWSIFQISKNEVAQICKFGFRARTISKVCTQDHSC